jgi:deoxycytidine triphosphate deaminase
MAASKGMIEPFEPQQVRERDGKRIVSYGTSSYGYDVRCATEFKIFTNIESAFVICESQGTPAGQRCLAAATRGAALRRL